jgi:hypothetical protein
MNNQRLKEIAANQQKTVPTGQLSWPATPFMPKPIPDREQPEASRADGRSPSRRRAGIFPLFLATFALLMFALPGTPHYWAMIGFDFAKITRNSPC